MNNPTISQKALTILSTVILSGAATAQQIELSQPPAYAASTVCAGDGCLSAQSHAK